jgi:hypothetical protein
MLNTNMPLDAVKDGAGWNLRQFLRFDLMQASAIDAALREKLCRPIWLR